MKKLILASMLLAFGSVYANEPAPTTPAPTPAHTKITRKDAKAACKAEGKSGKDFKACVKAKLHP